MTTLQFFLLFALTHFQWKYYSIKFVLTHVVMHLFSLCESHSVMTGKKSVGQVKILHFTISLRAFFLPVKVGSL